MQKTYNGITQVYTKYSLVRVIKPLGTAQVFLPLLQNVYLNKYSGCDSSCTFKSSFVCNDGYFQKVLGNV